MTETLHFPATRAERSLHRLGFPELRVTNGDGGKVKLVGVVSSPEERRIAFAATRCTPGITEIQCDLKIRS